jgi:hypothetical protein
MSLSFLVGGASRARFRGAESGPADLLQKAGKRATAEHALDGGGHTVPQAAIRRDEPDSPAGGVQLRRAFRDPVVRDLAAGAHQRRPLVERPLADESAGAATVEHDHRLHPFALRPLARPLDEPVLCQIGPARPHRVARVDEDDRLCDPLGLHGSSMR